MSGLAYNPGMKGADELIQGFVARKDLLDRMVEDLGATQPQHQLFIGQRGMGKTTLLRRIAAEVARKPELAARWIALTFPEEQYNVARLSDLWLNCLDALADALEREGDTAEVAALEQFVAGLPTDEAVRAPRALERLLAWTRAHRGMVLCIDNLQQVLGRLSKDERWALRKVLGEEQRLVVFAACPAAPAETTEYGEPFYDFFQAHSLRGLTLDETREVLQNLAGQAGKPELAASFAQKGGRLRALHVLTGGNPRTVVQLFDVVSAAPGAEIRGQLQGLLDQCTPLYKARFEELPEQGQLVLDALAHHWDPATAAIVAERTRMEVNSVSTQLHRLHNEGLVDKVDLPGEARQGFQVSERFFNLWYLMRASRRHRGRVLSLARCLETLYDIDDLQALGAQLLTGAGEADFSLAVAGALPEGGMQRALWSRVIDQMADQEQGLRELFAQMGANAGPAKDLAERKKRAKEGMEVAKGIDFEGMGVERELGEVLIAMIAMAGISGPALRSLVLLYPADWARAARLGSGPRVTLGPVLWRCLSRGVRDGLIPGIAPEDCDPSEIDAVALIHGCWQLQFFRSLECLQLEGSEGVDELVRGGDEALRSAMDRLAPSRPRVGTPAGIAGDTREGWELVLRAVGTRTTTPRLLTLFQHSTRRAVQLGSLDPIVLVATLGSNASADEIARATGGLLRSTDPGMFSFITPVMPLLGRLHPLPALRLYHHFASLTDPLEDTASLLTFLAALVRAGHTEDAFQIAVGLRDRAEPLHAAMFAVRGKDVALVGRFAPEIAIPARDMLQVLWPEGLAMPKPPRPGKKRRR